MTFSKQGIKRFLANIALLPLVLLAWIFSLIGVLTAWLVVKMQRVELRIVRWEVGFPKAEKETTPAPKKAGLQARNLVQIKA